MRLCANTGTALHLIRPLGFDLDDRRLRRAGLDYREWTRVREHGSLNEFLGLVKPARTLAFSTQGTRLYHEVRYRAGDALIFGPETRGLPRRVVEDAGPVHTLRIPMAPDSRSLNLSNAVAIVVYEAWRQCGFAGSLQTDVDAATP